MTRSEKVRAAYERFDHARQKASEDFLRARNRDKISIAGKFFAWRDFDETVRAAEKQYMKIHLTATDDEEATNDR